MARNFQRVHIYLPMLLMITVAMKVNADCTLPTGDEYAGTAFDPELDIYPSGTFLRMSCIQGTPRDGSSVSFCLGNAWQQSLLTCYANCDPPNSRNGAAYEPSMTSYTEGTTITYSCTNGNDLIGTDQATCRDGVWDPPPVIGNPSCSVCTVPSGGDDDNTLFVPVQSEYEPDDSVEMSCRDGTTGEGASNSVCDGESWEPELLICYADCEAPDVNVDVTYQPIQNAYTHGDVLIFSCLNGNNLRGDNETVCTNGAWEPATTTESPSCAGITTILPTTAPPTEDAVTTLTTSETDSVTSAATEAGVSTSATPNPETETNAGFSSGTASVFTTEPQDGTDMGSTTDTPDATEAELTTQVTDEPDIGSTTEIPVETMTSSLTTELPDSTGLTSEPVSGTETDLTSALNSGTESSDRTDSATESELTSQSDGETDATFSTTGTAGEIISGMTTAIPGTTELGLSSASGPGITTGPADGTEAIFTSETPSGTGLGLTTELPRETDSIFTETPVGTESGLSSTDSTAVSEGNTNFVITTALTDGTDFGDTTESPAGTEAGVTSGISGVTPRGTSTGNAMETESAPTTDGESDTASTSEISSGTESGVTTETSMDTDDVFSTRASRETESGLTSEVTQGTRAAMTTQSSSLSSQRSTVRVTGDTSQALTTEPSSETDSGLTSETTGATEAGLTTSAFGTSNTEARVTSASPGGTQFRTPTDVSIATLLISITEEPSDTRTSSTTTASSTSNPTSFESTQSTNAATTGLSQTSSTAEPTTNEAIATTAGIITEQNLCNGQCDEERQDCVNGECVCKEGFEIPYEESVCEPITFYSIVLAITELNGGSAIFTSELSNVGSTAFISLQLTVCTGLSRALDNFFLGFKSCSVISFVDGSIIATVRVGFANTTGLDRDGIDAALDLVENGFFGLTETNFTIDPSLTEVNPTDECALELDNCSPRANCMDRAENGFTCQCWDGYIDRSEAQYPGRDCATFSWKVVTITVSVIVGTMLLVAIILIACGQRIALACAKSRDRAAVKPNQGGGRPNGKQDKSVSTVEDTIPWHDQGDDHQVFYGRTADGQEAGKEFDSYDLEIYRSIPNAEERYTQVP